MEYDYIIAGGGSSACVAATRLVRDHGARVLLIERGPAHYARIMRMPAGYMKYLGRDDFLEMHEPVPQPQLGGRAPIVPQAKVLGGGSSVNAMVYMRGQREDYDGWDAMLGGHSGWSYGEMLPHFRALEHNTKFNDAYHGIDGGLWVSDPGSTCKMTEAFILAAQGAGIPYNPDFNGARQAGVGIMQHTMGRMRGRMERCDAVTAFLSQVMGDPRLTVVTDALVTRIIVEKGRAVGIEYKFGNALVTAHAAAEVLVATGSYNTAKLLMLSGIGPADHLAEHGVKVVADLPGVGQSLNDHHEVPVICSTKGAFGYFGEDTGWPMVRNGLQYLAFGTGPVTTTGIESCAFYDPDGGERPTIQLYCAPIVYLDRDITTMKPTHGVTLTSCLLRPKARGTVKLRSTDPAARPLVDSNFFGDPDDLRLTIASLRFARELLATAPVGAMIHDEMLPGAGKTSDAELAAFCSQTVKTNYHPTGTARMGRDDDPMAVLDTRLRVRGVDGLRVIDCSAMPAVPSGNTNAPVMALGDRAVAFITGEAV
ncbi:GMC family oxidoreductase N-terminal domain-containing protein [Kaistia dalseonensis]|uniref:Choline dehydrogenase n=1 Tax=Kaistia dalseonensis TaxID=410840 RepID=A0ABU0H6J1_9HYPH|nr:GMC family oxidoreductase N-terminal domain-containing protein [Kaistia dalseonensis]MCX5494814.1 GMC family oxidoreductase N-terminal domain-containing protein [Kaistia dalseonensis]MDQ0437395.1 choline dehydrogenase [Kaistia dalseonensis]